MRLVALDIQLLEATMTLTGGLIGESLRVGTVLEGVPLTVEKIYRADAGDQAAGQPLTWTLIEFAIPDDQADALARALSEALEPRLGWYCDFRSNDETFVVFADRLFRYPRGDQTSRAEVETYARSMGVPERQLDWPV